MTGLVDKMVLQDIKYFLNKVNERALFQGGHAENYDDGGDAALGLNVEYFHPQITLDDRMVYIMENIVTSGDTYQNIICNTIISHFYGARGIHQVVTRNPDPKTAIVNFQRLLVDEEYRTICGNNLVDAKAQKIPIYGSTELRTSLFGSANSYVPKIYGTPRDSHPINILLWVAGFIERGIVDKMYNAKSLKEMFGVLTTIEGIGSYYGYHCATSNSVNPAIKINHDERFCVPGPGARYTLDLLFEDGCKINYGDRVIWFRENYKDLIGDIFLHPSTHNVIVDGVKILPEEQDELKTYGCEVGLCQYGVYSRLKAKPHLINRRKVARLNEDVVSKFFEGSINQVVKRQPVVTKVIDACVIKPKVMKFPFDPTKDPDKALAILQGWEPTIEPEVVEAVEEYVEEVKKAEDKTFDSMMKDAVAYEKEKAKELKIKVKKPKKSFTAGVTIEKVKIILDIIEDLEVDNFSHREINAVVMAEPDHYGLKQESNWKESWIILQWLAEKGKLKKENKRYIKCYNYEK
jgi:hypothetical protein